MSTLRTLCSLATFAVVAEARAQVTAAPVADAAPGLLQAILGLGIVLALIWGAAWVIRRLAPGLGKQRNSLLKVIARQAVGAREHVVIVEVADRWLLLGVGAGNVRTLETLPKIEIPNDEPIAHSFAKILRAKRG